jgi:hypothetical protein
LYNTHRCQTLEQFRWKTRAMFAVVNGGLSEIRGQLSFSHFGRHTSLNIFFSSRTKFRCIMGHFGG